MLATQTETSADAAVSQSESDVRLMEHGIDPVPMPCIIIVGCFVSRSMGSLPLENIH